MSENYKRSIDFGKRCTHDPVGFKKVKGKGKDNFACCSNLKSCISGLSHQQTEAHTSCMSAVRFNFLI